MSTLDHWTKSFNQVGWFIPPYIQMGLLGELAATIQAAGQNFTQDDLERVLARFYEPIGVATMVLHRYPQVPVIQDYQATIGEAVEAHFFGLHHAAVATLAPVIEGAARRVAAERGVEARKIKTVFLNLTEHCKAAGVGAADEIESMMDSFHNFARDAFFENSDSYPFGDGTNRHGLAHGAYSDSDYGRPLNFYKTIAAVDFLTFVSSFRGGISWFAPEVTPESMRRAAYYGMLQSARRTKSAHDPKP